MDASFWINSLLLGAALAMDAFSVSVADGLAQPDMSRRKTLAIPTAFAVFQTMMPLAGWFAVHTVASYFTAFEKAVPYIALGLLGFLGGKMIWEDLRREEDAPGKRVTPAGLLVQALATSIDALSVGFTTQHYDFPQAAVSSLVIGAVTLALCAVGVRLGKTVGHKFRHAELVGGIILIGIGIEIFVKDVFF